MDVAPAAFTRIFGEQLKGFLQVRFRGECQHDIGGAQIVRVRFEINREHAGKDMGNGSHLYDIHSSSERN
jgi:hypothetical protein